MKPASVVLIIEAGMVLSIVRANGKLAILGGKQDPGENPEECAKREVKEESDLDVLSLVKLFCRDVPASSPEGMAFRTHCFYADSWLGIPKSSFEGEVKWCLASELISKETGAFPEYNSHTLEIFKQRFPEIELK